MTRSDERDRSVEPLLRQSLKNPPANGATDQCLDPDTAAAWIEGGLSGDALTAARSHVADCLRCQAVIAALARINPGTATAVPGAADRRWLGWLVPVTAAAAGIAAVAIWLAMPRTPASPTLESRQAVENSRPPAAPPLRSQPEPSAPAAAVTLGTDTKQPSTAQLKDQSKAVTASPPSAAAQEAANSDASIRRDSGQAGAARAAPPAPAGSAIDRAATAKSVAGLAESVATDVLSPNPAVRWRIVGASVQHSINGGASWESVSIGTTAQFLAGSAPSTTVCWLVGRGGAILLLTDGVRWTRIGFPEPVDLPAVRAVDALRASVTTADGRTFTTSDGGVTWSRPAPQDF
jgi:hypothetical protein